MLKDHGIDIDSTYPHLSRILDLVNAGAYVFEGEGFSVPSALSNIESDDTLELLLYAGLIRVYLIQGTNKSYVNKEDIEKLDAFVNNPNIKFREKLNRKACIVQLVEISRKSTNKELMKTFYNDFINNNLK